MRLEQLEYFIKTVDAESMNAAAEMLHTSQQNISKVIRALEESMHAELLIRTKKGVVPTEQGQRMYEFAKKQLTDYEAMRHEIRQIQYRKLEGQLSLAVTNSASSMILPQMLSDYYKEYPNVQLNVMDVKQNQVIRLVQTEKAEIGMVSTIQSKNQMIPEIPDELEYHNLLKGSSYFWVSKNSVYARRGSITFEEADKETIVIDNAIDIDLLSQLFLLRGLVMHVSVQSKSLPLLVRMVADGHGVFPDMLLDGLKEEFLYDYVFGHSPNVVAVPVKEAHPIHPGIGYLIKKGKKQSVLANHAVKLLESDYLLKKLQ